MRAMLKPGITIGIRMALFVLVLLPLASCARTPTRPILVETPTPLIAGQRWMAPIAIDSADAPMRPDPSPLRLSDGQTLPTRRVAMAWRPTGERAWLGDLGVWSMASSASPPPPPAIEMLMADLPATAVGHSIWLDGRRLPSFWIFPDESPARAPPALPPVPPEEVAGVLILVRGELNDPRLRWRAQMALQRLGIEAPPAPWGDPILHDWADQHRVRWRAAIHRLATVDAALADRLLRALTRWMRTPAGPLPAWPTDADQIEDLLLTLLLPEAGDGLLRRSVEAFLEGQPQWMAWVWDDAGGIVGGVLAVANLGNARALLSTRAPGGAWEVHGMLEPERVALLPAPAGSPEEGPVEQWEVRLAGHIGTLSVGSGAISLSPPGMAIGPFWHDWTLRGLGRQTASSPAVGSTGWIAGLVHRDPRMVSPSVETNASGLVLYCEVRSPPCEIGQGLPLSAVTIYFGPTDAPRAVATVRCTGLTTFDQGRPGESALFVQEADRWAFTLPIDRAWLEADGDVLIGMRWQPQDGPRSTWPRPLLPNQQAPGRARIDPTGWNPAPFNPADAP